MKECIEDNCQQNDCAEKCHQDAREEADKNCDADDRECHQKYQEQAKKCVESNCHHDRPTQCQQNCHEAAQEEAEEQCDKNDRECFENFKELGRECADKCEAVAAPAIRKTENTQKECQNKCKTTFSEKAKVKCEKITSSYEKMTSKCMATKCSKKSCKAKCHINAKKEAKEKCEKGDKDCYKKFTQNAETCSDKCV